MSSRDLSTLRLPNGYSAVRDRSRPGAVERLVEADRGGLRVALRLSPAAAGAEMRAELAVLASVSAPGLAALTDFGALPDGGSFVARRWIDGEDLATWAAGRPPREIGRLAAQLCPALHALHQRGFVHGDLKAANVLVTVENGVARPILTDFGLSRASGERGAASGTLFHIAPEVLLGGTLEPAADLFALGVMLHELLLGRRPTAREFYGKFPAYDFFESTGTRADELPEWASDVVAALLERERRLRPSSAAEVGSTLAGRLGLADLTRERRVGIHWPVSEGRVAWRERWLSEIESAPPPRLRWLYFTADENPRALVDELTLRAAVRGTRARRIDAGELRDAAAAQLEGRAKELCEQNADVMLFTALESNDASSLRAVEAIARAIALAPGERRPLGLVAGAGRCAPVSELPWAVAEVPEVDRAMLAEFLREHVEGDRARVEHFAALLAQAAAGSATSANTVLRRAAAEGWIVAGDARPRLRQGALPASLAERASIDALEPRSSSARLFGALHVLGGRGSLAEAGGLAGLDERVLTEAIATLAGAHLAVLEHGPTSASLRTLAELPPRPSDLLPESAWKSLHARRAKQLARVGAARASVLPHALRAGDASVAEVVEECELLRDRGNPEVALQLCDACIAERRRAGDEVEPELVGERALAWCAVGDGDRALDAIAEWNDSNTPAPKTRALAERVRGQVAMQRHEAAEALEHFERARAIDPNDGGLALLGKSRLLFELGRDREVLALVEELRASGGESSILPRAWAMLQVTEAMSVFRGGDVPRAKEMLDRHLADALEARDVGREAGVRINLATVERRAGDLARALEHFERAVALYEDAGLLPGLAQARAQFGSTLREVGELARAQPLLQSALALRERLGDRMGATSVRGMLGLLFADRGHARAATQELDRAASDLRETGRSRVAEMLEARAVETRVRFGDRTRLDARIANEAERAAEGDPRILLCRARAAWMCGDASAAAAHAERAEALARRLGLTAIAQESSALLARLEGTDEDAAGDALEGLAGEDSRIVALLSHAPFDVAAARTLADQLARRGRDDRAARVWLALAARGTDDSNAESAARAEELLAQCTRGLSPDETAALRRTLLSIPDPWPEDFVAHDRRRSPAEDDEMEVSGLLEINHRLLAQEDLRSLLGLIVEQALGVSGAQRGFLILEEEGELKVDTAMDSRRGDIDTPDVEVSGSVLREALAKMQPVRVSNAIDDPLLGAAPSVINLELRSILCVPFEVQRGLRGVIYVDHRLREGAFDARAQRMLSFLADQAALAILQVRRLEEIRRLNRELGKVVARKESDLKTATEALRKLNVPAPAGGLVGDSAPMREVRRLIERAAPSKLSILVTGPSGSGKELAARALHELGPRKEGPFVGENCAALPASLIEAELFGARKGAYTGADRDREGLFERSNGGTLFLDEVGELPLELQAKLLRVLETGQVRRLGDDRVRTVDVRLVTATNRDLGREVAENRFRADLYYRLDGLRITLPSLAARVEDIPALVDHYFRLNAEPGRAPRKIAPAVVAKLCRRAWPGNVRELFNELARLAVMSEGEITDESSVRDAEPGVAPPSVAAKTGVKSMEDLEREAILHALEVSGNDKRKAAQMLGISRAKVYQRLKDWGLTGGAKPESISS